VPPPAVLAVVGATHVEGIAERLQVQAARPSMHGNTSNASPARTYGPILGCCAYATFVGDGAEYACAARVWAQSVLETGTAHPVVIVATTQMHGGLGNLSGQVRLAHYPPAPSRGKHNFAVTFGKLWAGQLPYARVVYVDADTLVLRSLDHLFALGPKVALGAPRAYWLPQPFFQSGGPMLINTSSKRFSGALRQQLPPRYAGEMDWLNEVYGHSPHFSWDAVAGEYAMLIGEYIPSDRIYLYWTRRQR